MNGTKPLHTLTQSASSFRATLRLVSLTNLGVSRTRWLLGTFPPELVVENLLRGRLPPGQPPPPLVEVRQSMVDKWRDGLVAQDVAQIVAANQGVTVLDAGHNRWPFALDPDAVTEIVSGCRARTDRPLVAKLAPNDPWLAGTVRPRASAMARTWCGPAPQQMPT